MPKRNLTKNLKNQNSLFEKIPKSKTISKHTNESLLKRPCDSALWNDALTERDPAIESGTDPAIAEDTIRKHANFPAKPQTEQTDLNDVIVVLDTDPNDGVDMGPGDIADSK